MQSILERLPDSSALDGKITTVVSSFGTLSGLADGFSPEGLDSLLDAAQNLPFPDGLQLIERTLNNLGKMEQLIPTKPDEITAALKAGLEKLLAEMGGVNEKIKPVADIVAIVAPFIDKFDVFTQSVGRINTILAELPNQLSGLNLNNIPGLLQYVSNLFGMFPDIVDNSPFKELRAQFDTLKNWVNLNAADLSEQFRGEIQSLAEALPSQLNTVMQGGIAAVGLVATPVAGLQRSTWFEPYNNSLAVAAAMDLNDLSQIGSYISSLEVQVNQVNGVATSLNQRVQAVKSALRSFDVTLWSSDLLNAFDNITDVIAPEKPGVIAGLFHQIRRVLEGLEVSAAESSIAAIEQEIDKLFGEIDISVLTQTIEETADRIVSAIQVVDEMLVQAATTLSSLVQELKSLIGDINLPGMMSSIQIAFGQLDTASSDLKTQVETVSGSIADFVDDVGQDIKDLDISTLTGALEDLLRQITATLDDPQIRQILDEAKQGIDEVVENLEGISLKPAFDRMVEESAELETTLAKVDVSELNDFLKMALMAALEVIRNIDFAGEVRDVLQAQLQLILSRSTDLIEPLQEKFQLIDNKINQFSPGELSSARLSPPFEQMLDALNKIDPSVLFSPLQEARQLLVAQLEPLNPTTLLSPLVELHGKLKTAIQSLSPHALIQPLNDILRQVTGLIDNLGIEAFINQITGAVNNITGVLADFALGGALQDNALWRVLGEIELQGNGLLENIEAQLDQFLDRIITCVPEVDISVLRPALDAMQNAVDTIQDHMNNPQVLNDFNTMLSGLQTQNFNEGMTALTQAWQTQKTRFDAVTPPSELADDYAILKEKLNALSPISVLAIPVNQVGVVEASLVTMQTELSLTRDILLTRLAEGQASLNSLLPSETTTAAFKQLLRDTLTEQIGNPARAITNALKKKLQALSSVMEKIKAIAKRFQEPFKALTILPESITRIGDAIIDAKNKITNINLNFLEDELQGVLDDVIAQLDAVSPSIIISGLTTPYQNVVKALNALYPEDAIESIDNNYKTNVLGKVKELHPDKTVAQPLDRSFKYILELKEAINVDKIFDALDRKLDTIGKELDEGLDRAEKAFNELLTALPSASGSVGTSMAI